ncbi:MAG: cytochrome c-type biogenesis protein CcmH [Bryobacteraceae bacterium]|nr:cytochrome c-type biogenesis protein CcmH [Bryobacteraceae bacterium]
MRFLAWILSLTAAVSLVGQTALPNEERIRKLENSLLAPCCWAEPIAQHRSDVALQMKREIEDFVRQGKTDREILDFYKQKYGARVLVEPEGALWWWMHVVPFAVLAASLAVVGLVLRRWLRPLPAS